MSVSNPRKISGSANLDFWGVSTLKKAGFIHTINLKKIPVHTAGSDTIFFSYLLTCDVHLIKVLEIMAQMLQYIYIFKPETNK